MTAGDKCPAKGGFDQPFDEGLFVYVGRGAPHIRQEDLERLSNQLVTGIAELASKLLVGEENDTLRTDDEEAGGSRLSHEASSLSVVGDGLWQIDRIRRSRKCIRTRVKALQVIYHKEVRQSREIEPSDRTRGHTYRQAGHPGRPEFQWRAPSVLQGESSRERTTRLRELRPSWLSGTPREIPNVLAFCSQSVPGGIGSGYRLDGNQRSSWCQLPRRDRGQRFLVTGNLPVMPTVSSTALRRVAVARFWQSIIGEQTKQP